MNSTISRHFSLVAGSAMLADTESMMKMISRWFGVSRRHDSRDGDPYLESLARQLLLLRSGQAPRRPAFPRATDA